MAKSDHSWGMAIDFTVKDNFSPAVSHVIDSLKYAWGDSYKACEHRYKTVKKGEIYKCRKCGQTRQTIWSSGIITGTISADKIKAGTISTNPLFSCFDPAVTPEEVKAARIRQQLTPAQPLKELWAY